MAKLRLLHGLRTIGCEGGEGRRNRRGSPRPEKKRGKGSLRYVRQKRLDGG